MGMKVIRFKFSPAKAKAAIQWMLEQRQALDLHALLKACYFADKEHLNKYGRPIFGATYQAMKYGPVPLEIYEMAKGEPIWLAEMEEDQYPWQLNGYRLCMTPNARPNMDVLSETDLECLGLGFNQSVSMNFDARTAATHGRDWQAANLGLMRYEDMFDETPSNAERIDYLRETAPFIRL